MTIRVQVRDVDGDKRDFLNVVRRIYAGDSNYVRPLNADLGRRVSRENPFFTHAEGAVFTAHRDDQCVGRCTAQVDRAHLARHDDGSGFFGFFDTVDDDEVAQALLKHAAEWLAARGMRRMRGPISLSLNEEAGCLVEGFDSSPMMMMPHHRPYQGGLIERAGLQKAKDLLAWRYPLQEVPERIKKADAEMAAMPEVVTRNVDTSRLSEEVQAVTSVINDAWSHNWGFVPLTEAELAKMTADLKMLIVPELTFITRIEGQPAAVGLALPNVNEAIRDLDGKLFPFGALKLLWRLKVKRPHTARVVFLGIRSQFRRQRRYAGLAAHLHASLNRAGRAAGIDWAELSYTLEDNVRVNTMIRAMGGDAYRRYRIYERAIA